MIRLLIADDERMIREGLARALDWSRLGIGEVLLAKNGREAWDLLETVHPEIVLTDIMMPGMTGLELVSKDRLAGRRTKFIILSGHDSFRFAQQAIQNDVLQYLLKPCDPEALEASVREALEAIGGEASRERLVTALHEKLSHTLPQARLQFFRDLLVHGGCDADSFRVHQELFELRSGLCRLVLFRTNGGQGGVSDWLRMIAVKDVTERLVPQEECCACLMMDGLVVLLAQISDFRRMAALARQIKTECAAEYQLDMTIGISREGTLEEARTLYDEALEALKYAFYLGEGKIITAADIPSRVEVDGICATDSCAGPERSPGVESSTDAAVRTHADAAARTAADASDLAAAVGSGNVEEVRRLIQGAFERFLRMQGDIGRVRALALELYMALLRTCDAKEREACLQEMVRFVGLDTLVRMADLLMERATALAQRRFEAVVRGHNRIIDRVLACIDENLADETLCLSRIASEILYVNVDYLGKLFRKTTGVKFTQYLLEKRMEKARKLIAASPDDIRIYELAQAVGFGGNAGYFGQQFRKATGWTPKEYRQGSRG